MNEYNVYFTEAGKEGYNHRIYSAPDIAELADYLKEYHPNMAVHEISER